MDTNQRREQALEALAPGSEYLNCILSDSRTWMSLLGDGITKRDAVSFLVNRIHDELIH